MNRYDPKIHKRLSIRLEGYDYSLPGGYFITICTQNHKPFFGNIANDEVHPNEAGLMVKEKWQQLPERFQHIELDEMILMPDHLHAIIFLLETEAKEFVSNGKKETPVQRKRRNSLGEIIGAFKSITTREYIYGVKMYQWPPFDRRLWQRNYYDHIIRDDQDLENIRNYIRYNALKG